MGAHEHPQDSYTLTHVNPASHSGSVRLSAQGEGGLDSYLHSLSPEVLEWVRLRKSVAGRVVKRVHSTYCAFSLEEDGRAASPCGVYDELVLTKFEINEQVGRELRPLPPEQIARATAQRAAYLLEVNAPQRLARLRAMSSESDSTCGRLRPLTASPLGEDSNAEMADFKDWGYLTRFSPFEQSRSAMVQDGIYSRIGKYHRSVLCTAPMPDVSGSFDALWTSVRCHMLTVVPRGSYFADDARQLAMTKALLGEASSTQVPGVEDPALLEFARNLYRRNICVALGVQECYVNSFRRHYELGVRCFRLYSIATDIRIRVQVVRLVREILLRSRADDPIEFFVGQITSVEQYEDLRSALTVDEWAAIDGFYIGNGGGVRCKTAETGMIVNSPSLILALRGRVGMNGKSIVVEGGVGDEPAVALLFGASGLSHAAGVAGASIEAPNGGLFLFDGEAFWATQRGEASASTKLIEADSKDQSSLLYEDGEPRHIEGEAGFLLQEPRFVSMCGRVRVRNEWIAQCMVKLGVRTMGQLHALGVALTRAEFEATFGMNWSEVLAFGDLRELPAQGTHEARYVIPLPVRRRTNAMRTVAQSLGVWERTPAPVAPI